MTKMNPEIKARWVAALRSGEYKQAQGKLRDEQNSFCCLGVLCNLHALTHPEIAARQKDPFTYLGRENYPHDDVLGWAGLPIRCAEVVIQGRNTALWRHNDDGRTFTEIAKAIEEQL